eukprot:544099-Rhodomonas_salina.1
MHLSVTTRRQPHRKEGRKRRFKEGAKELPPGSASSEAWLALVGARVSPSSAPQAPSSSSAPDASTPRAAAV